MSTERPASGKHTDPLSSAAAEHGRRALEGYLPSGSARVSKVLCLEPDGRSRKRLTEATDGLRFTVHCAATTDEFAKAFAGDEYEVVVLSLDKDPQASAKLAEEIASSESPICVLLAARKPTLDQGVLAMRCGAIDLLAKPFDPQELRERLASAAQRAQNLRQQSRRLERLKRICRRLNEQRREVNTQVDVLCGDLAQAHQQLAEKATAGNPERFRAIIESELDVEALLRKTLEHMLTRTGPTNAAVFLPGSDGDYSLGAYVNYNLARDSADTLLDHLADVLPDRFCTEDRVTHLRSESQLQAVFESDAPWLSGSDLLATACFDEDGECLAVLTLFRDRAEPFTDAIIDEVSSLRDAFAAQLARVVRVHNRATPKAEWLGFDVGEEREDEDNSSDWGQDWGKAA